MDFDWKSLVGTIAPTIATALGGPMAGMAVKALSGVLLGKESGSEKEIAAALQGASPETLLNLKEADLAFEARMAELGVDLEKIAADDRNSARDREKSVGGNANAILASVVIAGFFGSVAAVLFGNVGADPATATLVGSVIGYASAKADQVVSYYFGSSAGSARKTEHMAANLKK